MTPDSSAEKRKLPRPLEDVVQDCARARGVSLATSPAEVVVGLPRSQPAAGGSGEGGDRRSPRKPAVPKHLMPKDDLDFSSDDGETEVMVYLDPTDVPMRHSRRKLELTAANFESIRQYQALPKYEQVALENYLEQGGRLTTQERDEALAVPAVVHSPDGGLTITAGNLSVVLKGPEANVLHCVVPVPAKTPAPSAAAAPPSKAE